MRKLTKLSVAVLVGALGIGLAGCGNQNTHKSASVHTTKEAHKSVKNVSKKSKKVHKSNKKSNNKQHNLGSSNSSKSEATTPAVKHSKVASRHNSSVSTSSNDGLPQVNLGNGVHATEDHGAGQTYISFTEDGHHVTVHGSNFGNGNSIAENKARSIAQNINKLPKNQSNVNVDTTNQ